MGPYLKDLVYKTVIISKSTDKPSLDGEHGFSNGSSLM